MHTLALAVMRSWVLQSLWILPGTGSDAKDFIISLYRGTPESGYNCMLGSFLVRIAGTEDLPVPGYR